MARYKEKILAAAKAEVDKLTNQYEANYELVNNQVAREAQKQRDIYQQTYQHTTRDKDLSIERASKDLGIAASARDSAEVELRKERDLNCLIEEQVK